MTTDEARRRLKARGLKLYLSETGFREQDRWTADACTDRPYGADLVERVHAPTRSAALAALVEQVEGSKEDE